MGKLKEVDPLICAGMITLTGIITILSMVSAVNSFFEMISDIAIALSGQPFG